MSIPVGLSTACVVPGSVPDTFAIAQELGVPVKFAGVGEGIDDLKPFDPVAFADALI